MIFDLFDWESQSKIINQSSKITFGCTDGATLTPLRRQCASLPEWETKQLYSGIKVYAGTVRRRGWQGKICFPTYLRLVSLPTPRHIAFAEIG